MYKWIWSVKKIFPPQWIGMHDCLRNLKHVFRSLIQIHLRGTSLIPLCIHENSIPQAEKCGRLEHARLSFILTWMVGWGVKYRSLLTGRNKLWMLHRNFSCKNRKYDDDIVEQTKNCIRIGKSYANPIIIRQISVRLFVRSWKFNLQTMQHMHMCFPVWTNMSPRHVLSF